MTKVLNTLSAVGALVMAATPLLAIGGFAHAQDINAAPARIAVSNLDLRSPGDAAIFRQRVDTAARGLCEHAGVSSLNAAATCRQAVYEEAVEKLGASQQRDLQSAKTDHRDRLALAER